MKILEIEKLYFQFSFMIFSFQKTKTHKQRQNFEKKRKMSKLENVQFLEIM